MDQTTKDRIEKIHPNLRPEVRQIYKEICEALEGRAICRFAYTLRTIREQNELYAIGRTKPGKIVTNARGGSSWHNFGMALDIVLIKDTNKDGTFDTASWETNVDFDGDGMSDWQEVVHVFKSYGWEWGGDWKFTDKPHFQKTKGLTIKEVQNMPTYKGTPYPIL